LAAACGCGCGFVRCVFAVFAFFIGCRRLKSPLTRLQDIFELGKLRIDICAGEPVALLAQRHGKLTAEIVIYAVPCFLIMLGGRLMNAIRNLRCPALLIISMHSNLTEKLSVRMT